MFQDPANPDPQNGWENVWSYEANPTALGMSNTSTQSNTTLPMTAQINVALLNDQGGIDQYTTTVPIFTPQPQAAGQLLPPRLPAVQAPPAPARSPVTVAGPVRVGEWVAAGRAVALAAELVAADLAAVLVGEWVVAEPVEVVRAAVVAARRTR